MIVPMDRFFFSWKWSNIECPGVSSGTSTNTIDGVVGPKTYIALNVTALKAKPISDADWDCVCTSLLRHGGFIQRCNYF